MSLGVAMYGASGMGIDWEDELILTDNHDRIKATVNFVSFAVQMPVALAVRITDKFAIGVNFVLYGRGLCGAGDCYPPAIRDLVY